jgi:hypothetical protein
LKRVTVTSADDRWSWTYREAREDGSEVGIEGNDRYDSSDAATDAARAAYPDASVEVSGIADPGPDARAVALAELPRALAGMLVAIVMYLIWRARRQKTADDDG